MEKERTTEARHAGQLEKLSSYVQKNSIDPQLYTENDVKRGLRDHDGKGVLCGLTEVSEVNAFRMIDGVKTPIDGELIYRGIDVKQLIENCTAENRFGFEECIYLLLFGRLPGQIDLREFSRLLADFRSLPRSFVRDVIMKSPSSDIMNMLARCVLSLYSYDPNPDDISVPNVLKQSLRLIAQFPQLAVYAYRADQYYNAGSSLIIHQPVPEYSCAQNILHMIRKNNRFTDLEAKTLDACLILHAEHGGGNNSTFTTHVVTSTGTDTYSAVAASLGSLKGPKHGGANIKVMGMMENIKENLHNNWSENNIRDYLYKILNKEAFDKTGLIYGMGHAVYSLSDPRAEILKVFAGKLAIEKGMEREFELYNTIAKNATELIMEQRNTLKHVCPNVDFYSGFVYSMLNLPRIMFTPVFAISRIAGWSAHRMEEIANGGKIIRPAYMCVRPRSIYVPLSERR